MDIDEPKPEPKLSFSEKLSRLKVRLIFLRLDIISFFKRISTWGWEKIIINIFITLGLASIVIGLIVFVVYLFKLSEHYTVKGNDPDPAITGQFGDFIGGTVGAIWSLTGALLFYAALRIQSNELVQSRRQFQISRLTDVLYKQLEMFNQQLSLIELLDLKKDTHKGRAALSLIQKRIQGSAKSMMIKQKDADEIKPDETLFAENFAFLQINLDVLEDLYELIDGQCSIIETLLIKEDIPPVELSELKALFFHNIGKGFLNTNDLFPMIIEAYVNMLERKGQSFDKSFSPEYVILRKIQSIERFRLKKYDKETIKKDLKSRDFRTNIHF